MCVKFYKQDIRGNYLIIMQFFKYFVYFNDQELFLWYIYIQMIDFKLLKEKSE